MAWKKTSQSASHKLIKELPDNNSMLPPTHFRFSSSRFPAADMWAWLSRLFNWRCWDFKTDKRLSRRVSSPEVGVCPLFRSSLPDNLSIPLVSWNSRFKLTYYIVWAVFFAQFFVFSVVLIRLFYWLISVDFCRKLHQNLPNPWVFCLSFEFFRPWVFLARSKEKAWFN